MAAGATQVLVPALVSGVVAFVVGMLTVAATLSSQRLERRKHERQIQREMTLLLYQKRLEAYPRFIQLTEPLRHSRIAEGVESPQYFRRIVDDIDEWSAGQAGFLLSLKSLNELYDLRATLSVEPTGPGAVYSAAQLHAISERRKNFRASLRNDLNLVYGEEGDKSPIPFLR